MKKSIIFTFFLFLFSILISYAYPEDFKFGDIKMPEINLKTYSGDTTATAVILCEYGYTRFDNETYNLLFRYHVRLKILNKDGLKHANFEIPVRKQGSEEEIFRLEDAATFSYNDGKLSSVKLDQKNIFKENLNNYFDLYKFTMPDVQEGSIFEVQYEIESPFIFNYRQWNFQSDIPKLESIYEANIPANYQYSISLHGFLKLDINDGRVLNDCFGRGVAKKADCSVFYYGMKNIPAFVKEDFMTAPANFISSVQFELSAITNFYGVTDKITKTWKDAESELRNDNRFGKQLKQGKDIYKKVLDPLVSTIQDPTEKATAIYDFIKQNFKWNGYY